MRCSKFIKNCIKFVIKITVNGTPIKPKKTVKILPFFVCGSILPQPQNICDFVNKIKILFKKLIFLNI